MPRFLLIFSVMSFHTNVNKVEETTLSSIDPQIWRVERVEKLNVRIRSTYILESEQY